MSDQPWEMNDYLNYIGEQTGRVAAALERALELVGPLLEQLAAPVTTLPPNPQWSIQPRGSQPPGTPPPLHWPVLPAQPRDPRPSTITC